MHTSTHAIVQKGDMKKKTKMPSIVKPITWRMDPPEGMTMHTGVGFCIETVPKGAVLEYTGELKSLVPPGRRKNMPIAYAVFSDTTTGKKYHCPLSQAQEWIDQGILREVK